jgi:two-component sensor histidine kinase
MKQKSGTDKASAAAPFRQGFGKSLLERGLNPFHGHVEMKFGPTGFVCRITFAVPHPRRSPLPHGFVTGAQSAAI